MSARERRKASVDLEKQRLAARQMAGDAKRLEARAMIAAPGHAEQLRGQARALRAAADRIAGRMREQEGGFLL
jgi:hypothetical protein